MHLVTFSSSLSYLLYLSHFILSIIYYLIIIYYLTIYYLIYHLLSYLLSYLVTHAFIHSFQLMYWVLTMCHLSCERERRAFCTLLTVPLDIGPQMHHVIPEQSTQIHISCCAIWSLGSASYIHTYSYCGINAVFHMFPDIWFWYIFLFYSFSFVFPFRVCLSTYSFWFPFRDAGLDTPH